MQNLRHHGKCIFIYHQRTQHYALNVECLWLQVPVGIIYRGSLPFLVLFVVVFVGITGAKLYKIFGTELGFQENRRIIHRETALKGEFLSNSIMLLTVFSVATG